MGGALLGDQLPPGGRGMSRRPLLECKTEGRGREQHIPDLRENAEKESGTLTESTLRFGDSVGSGNRSLWVLTGLLVSFNRALELKSIGGEYSMCWQNKQRRGFHCNKNNWETITHRNACN